LPYGDIMNNKRWFLLPVSSVLLLLATTVLAKRLESIGNTIPIAEPSLLEVIHDHLQQMDEAGLITAQQQQFQTNAKKTLQRPKPIELPVTVTPQTRIFDPSITVFDPIKDVSGHVIVTAGSSVNPLDTIALRQPLLFFNADDNVQQCWAKQKLTKYPQAKIIITQGNIAITSKQFNSPIYFDQGGRLIHRFDIHQVPAMVTQTGKQLTIHEEFACDQ